MVVDSEWENKTRLRGAAHASRLVRSLMTYNPGTALRLHFLVRSSLIWDFKWIDYTNGIFLSERIVLFYIYLVKLVQSIHTMSACFYKVAFSTSYAHIAGYSKELLTQ
jgi:hypothetical protein